MSGPPETLHRRPIRVRGVCVPPTSGVPPTIDMHIDTQKSDKPTRELTKMKMRRPTKRDDRRNETTTKRDNDETRKTTTRKVKQKLETRTKENWVRYEQTESDLPASMSKTSGRETSVK